MPEHATRPAIRARRALRALERGRGALVDAASAEDPRPFLLAARSEIEAALAAVESALSTVTGEVTVWVTLDTSAFREALEADASALAAVTHVPALVDGSDDLLTSALGEFPPIPMLARGGLVSRPTDRFTLR